MITKISLALILSSLIQQSNAQAHRGTLKLDSALVSIIIQYSIDQEYDGIGLIELCTRASKGQMTYSISEVINRSDIKILPSYFIQLDNLPIIIYTGFESQLKLNLVGKRRLTKKISKYWNPDGDTNLRGFLTMRVISHHDTWRFDIIQNKVVNLIKKSSRLF